jgi:hypothetical protein
VITTIPGGTFCDDPHRYIDDAGNWVPSLTQVLKLAGLYDYGIIDNADLEPSGNGNGNLSKFAINMQNAARRGTLIHELIEVWNKEHDLDPNWVTDEIGGYFGGYRRFLADTGFVCDPTWAEAPMIATIRGMRIGMRPDVFGKMRRDKAVVEIKATAGVQAAWSIQTALQELGIHASNNVGRVRRYALQLFKDGRYKLHEHSNHQQDEAVGIAALRLVWWRLEQGQKLWLAGQE